MSHKKKQRPRREAKCIYCAKVIDLSPNGRIKPHLIGERQCLGSGNYPRHVIRAP